MGTVVLMQSRLNGTQRGEARKRLSEISKKRSLLSEYRHEDSQRDAVAMGGKTKARASAQGKACSLRLIGCTGGLLDGTTVLAHIRTAGTGMSRKPSDSMAVYACDHCHDVIDGRKSSPMMKKEIQERVIKALAETHDQMISENVMVML